MKRSRVSLKILEDCHCRLQSYDYLCRSRYKSSHFTRERKLGFIETMVFIIQGIKHSLQAEINHYLDMLKRKDETYSKQAFSKGRQRIKPEAFKELSEIVIQDVYSTVPTKTFDGYHILAIDGSRYNLPTNAELNEIFGVQITGNAPQPQALGSCLYDVLNGLVVDACFGGCRDNERVHAREMICRVDTELIHNPLYIMDRGYPSGALMELIEKLGQKYLMRCDKTFLRSMEVNGSDAIITHKFAAH